ncbi:3-methyl-2-oxobutanoate dehydrogenase subunit VorB [bacterium]|nr:3-methyl-2-oxobutanoate dehydrogenase subunit VorB [bacterium]MBU1638817.1 3-methyl-2-oxobutanoate dehydrogenase subunit VorB [bacterium]MBU1919480.1 3-methyl-2-oxobutanoate dehydrogenase subunit VorB [bacterium]
MELIKANEAVVKAAILAGCTQYYGYPITPASEVAMASAKYLPKVGGTFLQAESEVAAINMVYGASGAGARVMTASSGPGISLKQEGVSYMAASELPCVIVDVMRAGPGLGNIWPEQGDWNQVVHGGGHGNYKVIVLTPNCAQEMCDLTILAFELAEKYRTPVYLLTDAYIGQMMEPVNFPKERVKPARKDWALYADADSHKNLVSSIFMSTGGLEEHNIHLQEKYAEIEKNEVRYQEVMVEDADLVMIGYGFISRMLLSVTEILREEGYKVGLLRPITAFPFCSKRLEELAGQGKTFLDVELSNGQMLRDVRLAVGKDATVHFYNRMGGIVPSVEELTNVARGYLK